MTPENLELLKITLPLLGAGLAQAVWAIRNQGAQTAEIAYLKERNQELIQQNRQLEDRVEKLEAALQEASFARLLNNRHGGPQA